MKAVHASPENVQLFVKACIVLHNFLTKMDPRYAHDYGDNLQEGVIVEGQWRTDAGMQKRTSFVDLSPKAGQNSSQEAKAVRDNFKRYFNNEGSVPWQDEAIDKDGHA